MNKRHGLHLFRSHASEDFTSFSLPHTRKAEFTDIIKCRYDLLFKSGLTFLVFALPFLVLLFLEYAYLLGASSSYQNGSITLEVYQASTWQIHLIFRLAEAVSLLIIGVAFAGITRIYRLVILGEPVEFKSDFKNGLKHNIGQTMGVFSIFAIIYAICSLCICYGITFSRNDFTSTALLFLPVGVSFVFFLPLLLFHLCEIPLYQNSFKSNARNALAFYAKEWWWNLLLSLAFFALPFVMLIPSLLGLTLAGVFYFFLLLPFSFLLVDLRAVYLFDEVLNKDSFPELYGKGIALLSEEETMEFLAFKRKKKELAAQKKKERKKK